MLDDLKRQIESASIRTVVGDLARATTGFGATGKRELELRRFVRAATVDCVEVTGGSVRAVESTEHGQTADDDHLPTRPGGDDGMA